MTSMELKEKEKDKLEQPPTYEESALLNEGVKKVITVFGSVFWVNFWVNFWVLFAIFWGRSSPWGEALRPAGVDGKKKKIANSNFS